MKIMTFHRIVFLSLLHWAFPGSAIVAQGIVPLAVHGQSALPTGFGVIGGQNIAIDFHIPASVERKNVTIDIWQVVGPAGNGTAVYLQKNVPLENLFRKGTDTFDFQPPTVKRRTAMAVSFREKAGDPKTGSRIRLGHVWLNVYPDIPLRETAKPLADALRHYQTANPSALPAILFFGSGEFIAPLRAFLEDCDIPFQDAGEDLDWMTRDEAAASVLHIGHLLNSAQPNPFFALEKGRWLVFSGGIDAFFRTHNSSLAWYMPGIYSKTTPGGVLTRVTLPLLQQLADDPRAREVLLELITDAVAPVLNEDVTK
jgi:hypothetical protein